MGIVDNGVDAGKTVVERTTRLLSYLSAVAREIGPEPLRDVTTRQFALWRSSVPEHSAVRVGTSPDRTAWLTVSKVEAPKPPLVPTLLAGVLDEVELTNPESEPELSSALLAQYIADEVDHAMPEWREQEIAKWEAKQSSERSNDTDVDRTSMDSDAGISTRNASSRQIVQDQEVQAAVDLIKNEFVRSLDSELRTQFTEWVTSTWTDWAERARPIVEVRKLYSRLFEQQMRLESESATLELIWGHCVLSYLSPASKRIIAPLVSVTATIQVDPKSGTIRVHPEGNPEIELSALEGAEVAGVERLQRLQEEFAQDPLDLWNEVDRTNLAHQLIAPLGVDARLVNSGDLDFEPPRNEPVLTESWVLFVRERPLRQEAFYQKLAQKLEKDELVPDALASIVADSETVDRALRMSGQGVQRNDGSAERLLMPLPINADQERIAHQLANSRGVTVQGPPGTGKSHTIVNLVSHLVAQGKRVLVTAQNEQALSVVRNKIPEELRDLSIAVLGSTPAALEEMRGSAQAMQDSLSQVDTERGPGKLAEVGSRIDDLREEARRIDLDLISALQSEQREFELPAGAMRASGVAQWMAARPELAFIPDSPTKDQPLPLSVEELTELAYLADSIADSDAKESMRLLPVGEWIWSSAQLQSAIDEESTLRPEVNRLEEAGLRVDAADSWSDEDIFALAGSLREQAEVLAQLAGVWESAVAAEVRSNTELGHWLEERNRDLYSRISALREASDHLLGQEVVVPDLDPQVLEQHFHTWEERLSAGKKLPAFGAKELKALAAQITVSGYPVTNPEQLNLVRWQVHLRKISHEVHSLMQGIYQPFGIPVPDQGPAFPIATATLQQRVSRVVDWWRREHPTLLQRVRSLMHAPAEVLTVESMRDAADTLRDVSKQRRLQRIENEKRELRLRVIRNGQEDSSSLLWNELIEALDGRDVARWEGARKEALRLSEVRQLVERRVQLHTRLSAGGAPNWANAIVDTRGAASSLGRTDLINEAWVYAQARQWISELHAGADVERLMEAAHETRQEIEKRVIDYGSLSARLRLKAQMKDPQRRALETWLTAIRRVGRGTGKYAPRYQAQAQAALPAAMGAVPIWIMPIYRVLENFDPQRSEMFDVVIVDESSQCDLLSLGVLALGRKTVVVGDDKQTSPRAVGMNKSRFFELQHQHISDFPDKSLLTLDESLYSISARAFPSTILLREHFRCVPEIIGFSNRFYGGRILPLREVTVPQIGDPIRVVHVEDGASVKQGSQRVNKREAEALVRQVIECSKDPAYDGLTFGVVTMMSGPQSDLIEAQLMDAMGLEEFEARRLRVGNPPMFQGDERNVIFLSFVADDNSYAAVKEAEAQWANVAASRAQDQLWMFHTMDPATLHPNDNRRMLLEYGQGVGSQQPLDDLLELTESKFEADVLRAITARGYKVIPQHKVGAFRIDMVVDLGNAYRLAVECDGDAYHGPDHWESDVRRQRVLERLGWNFWRVRASAYYLDPEESLQSLWQRLDELAELSRAQEEQRARQLARKAELAEDGSSSQAVSSSRSQNDAGSYTGGELLVEFGRGAAIPSDDVAPEEGSFGASSSGLNAMPADEGRVPETLRSNVTPRLRPSTTSNSNAREWAIKSGYQVGRRGRLPQEILDAYEKAMGNDSVRFPESRYHDLESMTPEKPDEDAVLQAWKVGTRYRMAADGMIVRIGSDESLESVVGEEKAAEIARSFRAVRKGGGIFKVGPMGEIVTLVGDVPQFIGYFM